MGMNPRGRSRGRNHNNYNNNNNNNNNNRRYSNGVSRNTVFDSSGPAGRIRGTAFQLMEKYLTAAKDAMSSDRVLAESCLQHADHYARLNAMAIASEVRPNHIPQHTSEEAIPAGETSSSASAHEESVVAPVHDLPVNQEEKTVFVSFPKKEEKLADIDVDAYAGMDLSVPVMAMSETAEAKPRRGRRPSIKTETSADTVPAVKRRGRPSTKKEASA